jgi:acetylornithine deacetylase
MKLHTLLTTFLLSASALADESPLISLHKSLVSIPSVSGSEHDVAIWLKDYLESKSFTVETQRVGKRGERPRLNVFAYVGETRNTSALLTSHIDTVPPFIPYSYNPSKDRIYGRGSDDAKASVASQLIAVEELLADGSIGEGDVGVLYVVGEEVDGIGMKTANDLNVSWDTVIFGEPTELKLAVGHKGMLILDVIAKGKASHSGYPELGINANSHLIEALAVLDKLPLPGSKLLGNTTLNVGRIDGGVAANVISAYAKAQVAVRVAGDLDAIHDKIDKTLKKFKVEVSWWNQSYGPVTLDYDVKGFDTIVCNYGTDVPNLKGDHKKYLYGPGS